MVFDHVFPFLSCRIFLRGNLVAEGRSFSFLTFWPPLSEWRGTFEDQHVEFHYASSKQDLEISVQKIWPKRLWIIDASSLHSSITPFRCVLNASKSGLRWLRLTMIPKSGPFIRLRDMALVDGSHDLKTEVVIAGQGTVNMIIRKDGTVHMVTETGRDRSCSTNHTQ